MAIFDSYYPLTKFSASIRHCSILQLPSKRVSAIIIYIKK